MMNRIAIKSNYDRETFDEMFLNIPPLQQDLAREICKLLNKINPEGENYYVTVHLNYELCKFEI